ncbi:MAG: hypothetical protein QM692_13505 [Thermomicrobiales bacterium]
MDGERIEAAIVRIAASRRRLLGVVAAVAGASAEQHSAGARKKKRKRKGCAKAGQATSRKRKRCCGGLVTDASGVCAIPQTTTSSPCAPSTCPPDGCGSVPDGCGGTLACGCGAGLTCMFGACHPCVLVADVCQPCITVDSVCEPCDVVCDGDDPQACGWLALQEAVDGGGTVIVCPGRYGVVKLTEAVRIVGAGSGPNPATNTIVGDAGNFAVEIDYQTGAVALENLRISGGVTSGSGGGISHGGTALTMTDCAVVGNTAYQHGSAIMVYPDRTLDMLRCTVAGNTISDPSNSNSGGAIASSGLTTLTDCLVEDNHGGASGGGILVMGGTTTLLGETIVRGNSAAHGGGIDNGSSLIVAETCRVTGNRATELGEGGGIATDVLGTVTLQGADPSPIVTGNCPDNCWGDVPKCAVTPVDCSA